VVRREIWKAAKEKYETRIKVLWNEKFIIILRNWVIQEDEKI
jgi:hypothetical protein